jgi:ferredoxin
MTAEQLAARVVLQLVGSPAEGVHVVAASAGFLSFAFIWATVMWGIFLRNGWASTRVRHSTLLSSHMTLGLLGLCLGLVHGLSQIAAPVTATGFVDVVVPFLNLGNPAWGDLPTAVRLGEGVGVLALELMTAATLAVLLKRRLGAGRARVVHQLNHAGYLLMVTHILVSGSDAGRWWAWGTVLASLVVTALSWLASTQRAARLRSRGEDAIGIQRPGTRIAVEVDSQRCTRFGFCEHEAPTVFQLRGDGRLVYNASVSVELADDVLRAVRVCPARAISLGQESAQVVMARAGGSDDSGPLRTWIPTEQPRKRGKQ